MKTTDQPKPTPQLRESLDQVTAQIDHVEVMIRLAQTARGIAEGHLGDGGWDIICQMEALMALAERLQDHLSASREGATVCAMPRVQTSPGR